MACETATRIGLVSLLLGLAGATAGPAEAQQATEEAPPPAGERPDQTGPDTRQRPGREPETARGPDLRPAPPALTRSDIMLCETPGHAERPCAPAVADRWRLAETLGLVSPRWWDPYNQNTLKGDRPIAGSSDLFIVAGLVSDTVIEPRAFPVPIGVQTSERPASNDVFGDPDSLALSQTAIASVALVKGSTAFKPQDLEARIALAFNYNYAKVSERRLLNVAPSKGLERSDAFIGVQELFFDRHLRNVSSRYDFDSVRIGIQPFSSDFRGFLFQDNQPGVRLFGSRDNNRLQYNLAAFARLEKDTNSGLNDILADPRRDLILFANAYRQDFLIPGLTSQLSLAINLNREGDRIETDDNGFPVRPALLGALRGRSYDVGYIGYNADGRIGRANLTVSAYGALGEDRGNPFTGEDADIRAFFVAAEPSIDFDWVRLRASALFASGDDDPFDNVETGYDAIFENPQFAGADTSYWIRQSVPLIGGARAVSLNGRNGLLNSLRSSKEQGQSNFANPGTTLLGIGADADILPELRVSANLNRLGFATAAPLEALRMQPDISSDIGWDISLSAIWRPLFIQNIVLRASAAILAPTDRFQRVIAAEDRRTAYHSVLLNAVLTY
jgi:hypothetical protein